MTEETYVDINVVERLTALPRSWLYAKGSGRRNSASQGGEILKI
jgi:hypothetical protein